MTWICYKDLDTPKASQLVSNCSRYEGVRKEMRPLLNGRGRVVPTTYIVLEDVLEYLERQIKIRPTHYVRYSNLIDIFRRIR